MPRKIRYLAAVAAVAASLAMTGLMTAGSASAAITPRSSPPTAAATCARTEVTIHSHGSPGVQCLTAVRPGMSPAAGTDTTCPTDDLVLYWNGPIGVYPNYLLCVNGLGLLNLNQNFYGLNWNDEASAWWTGCTNVFFYDDINQGGGSAFEYGSPLGESSPRGIFPDQGVGNDQLSSVYLSSPWGC